jgi:hypothetical protein
MRAPLTMALMLLLAPAAAMAAPYPTNTCVGSKLKAAAKHCSSVYRAWAAFQTNQNASQRDGAIADAGLKLADDWANAEQKSNVDNIDCVDTTATSAAIQSLVEAGAAATAADINDGLSNDSDDRRCSARILRAAAMRCKNILRAQGDYVKNVDRADVGSRRTSTIDIAEARFAIKFSKATGSGNCPTTATLEDTEAQLDQVSGDVFLSNVVSPNVPQTSTMITPPSGISYLGQTLNPICSRGTPYAYWVRRGTNNKLLMYYQGGGACWSAVTCSEVVGIFDDEVTPSDNPALATTGLADLSNPDNPFKDWNIVFVSYCTGDIHFGDAFQDYVIDSTHVPIHHRGWINSQVVEKWAREHFVAPDELFITGSSAGAYGAIFNSAWLMHRTWPAARAFVLGDAGNGVITTDFQQNYLGNWNFDPHVPRFIPALDQPFADIEFGELYPAAAGFFPDARFGQYTTAFDGGLGGQTSFYQVMLNPNNLLAWPNWWQASCGWNAGMQQLAVDTAAAAPANYRYYIGAGSRHVMWNADKVYTETKGGVIPVVEWLNNMLGDGVGWDNIQTSDVSRNPGTCAVDPMVSCFANSDCTSGSCDGEDPAPEPLQAPFGPAGAITCP